MLNKDLVTGAVARAEMAKIKAEQEKRGLDIAELLLGIARVDQSELDFWILESEGDEEERERRKQIVRQIKEQIDFLTEAAVAVESGRVALSDIERDERVATAQKTLQGLLDHNDLNRIFEKSQEIESNGRNMFPAFDFDPDWYSPEQIQGANNDLMRAIQDIRDLDVETEADVGRVSQFLTDPSVLAQAVEHASSERVGNIDSFSLSWIRESEPEAWAAICRLVQVDRRILYAILGQVQDFTDDFRNEDSAGAQVQEIYERQGNVLNIALHNSILALGESEHSALRQSEKTALTEFYGDLPQELDYEAEAMLIEIEVGRICEQISEANDKELIAEGLRGLFRMEMASRAYMAYTRGIYRRDMKGFTEALGRSVEKGEIKVGDLRRVILRMTDATVLLLEGSAKYNRYGVRQAIFGEKEPDEKYREQLKAAYAFLKFFNEGLFKVDPTRSGNQVDSDEIADSGVASALSEAWFERYKRSQANRLQDNAYFLLFWKRHGNKRYEEIRSTDIEVSMYEPIANSAISLVRNLNEEYIRQVRGLFPENGRADYERDFSRWCLINSYLVSRGDSPTERRILDFTGIDFEEADLTNTRIQEVVMDNADFRRARLTGANLYAQANFVDFSQADLRDAQFTIGFGELWKEAHFDGADLEDMSLMPEHLLRSAYFAGAKNIPDNIVEELDRNQKYVNPRAYEDS